jgi:hypothetical protein
MTTARSSATRQADKSTAVGNDGVVERRDYIQIRKPGPLDQVRDERISSLLKRTERSDSTILGILGILAHFRHFPVYPG